MGAVVQQFSAPGAKRPAPWGFDPRVRLFKSCAVVQLHCGAEEVKSLIRGAEGEKV